jgi:hypothetical protein
MNEMRLLRASNFKISMIALAMTRAQNWIPADAGRTVLMADTNVCPTETKEGHGMPRPYNRKSPIKNCNLDFRFAGMTMFSIENQKSEIENPQSATGKSAIRN